MKTVLQTGPGAPPLETQSRCLYTVSVDPKGLRQRRLLAGYRWASGKFVDVLPLVGDGPLIGRTARITGVAAADIECRIRDLVQALPGALLMSELERASEFRTALTDVEAALASSDEFSRTLAADAAAYIRRVEQRGDLRISHGDALELSREYVTNEVAMYLCQARRGYLVDCYVGSELPVLRKFIAGELSGLLPPLERRIFIGLAPEKEE